MPETARYLMLIESQASCPDMGIWGLNDGWGLKEGFFMHPTRWMQGLYLDGHAKSTKFGQTLGTSNADQQWTWWPSAYAAVNQARADLRKPRVREMFE